VNGWRKLTVEGTTLMLGMKQASYSLISGISSQGWQTLLSFSVKQPRCFSQMIYTNQAGKWFYEKRSVPNAKWLIQQMYS
jgi:hypothetical protein